VLIKLNAFREMSPVQLPVISFAVDSAVFHLSQRMKELK